MRALSDQDHPVLERWAGMADAETAVVQDAHLGGLPGLPGRHRVQAGTPPWLPAHRRPRRVHRRDPVPALVEEGGARHQLGEREPAAGGAGEPVRVRRLPGVDAQAAAGIRRRDRARDRELPRPDRVLRHLALPRRRLRGLLQGPQPEHDGPGPGRLLRVGPRRRPGRGGGLLRRRRRPHRGRPPHPRPGSPRHGRHPAPTARP